MILFVFEGAAREPRIFRTLQRLFYGEGEATFCSFGNNIYELFRQLKELDGDGDLVSILKENKADLPPDAKASDFSEIYLFFDYDFQNINLSIEDMNKRLAEMLEVFCNETENGKLYVSYPMIESLCYTKELPDAHFSEYIVSRSECMKCSFKDLARFFSSYNSFNFIELSDLRHHKTGEKEIQKVRKNWLYLVQQHSSKANYICNDCNDKPGNKEDISQRRIFEAQCSKYLCNNESIAILSSFPLFLFDYFKELK